MSGSERRFAVADIEAFLASAFVALRVPPGDARAVAQLMVRADLYGYGSHGTIRLRQYVNRLRDGGTNPRAKITIAVEHAATALVDGDNGLGHLAMLRATKLAIAKAATAGMAWVGVRNGNHAGPASLYVTMAVAEDMIGIYGAVGSANHVPPFGGMDLLLGTNPIAVAVPAGESPPFVLDMATTVAAAGKIKALAQRGETMPEGWMVGPDGAPLTDPTRHKEGFLLPIGGAKGYGLAIAIGLLAGTLNGAAFGKDVVEFSEDTTSATNTGQFIAAISVAAFADVAAFKAAVDSVLAQMVASRTLPGHDRVRIPGDRRGAIFADRTANGIPLHPGLLESLAATADELNIPKLA
jgi:LDH2 family malate/lactate/ureidoglycolate dehydrogenase